MAVNARGVGALHGDRRPPLAVMPAEKLDQLRRKIAAIPARSDGSTTAGMTGSVTSGRSRRLLWVASMKMVYGPDSDLTGVS
ncbi:hypothetical protein R4282_07260 [Rhodococcus oxybenzonivorans]|uniref:hypothetical protein n=1 Tax=Rhodococcus oxybenzonivorans TaxID=1990687 RepID=UPI0029542BF9|nr:hypothetical protein [Rhodococcus oxybenzonivorans]MDV7352807.1 hypothetical protein [Rhodococcus oxybenzonivorans]